MPESPVPSRSDRVKNTSYNRFKPNLLLLTLRLAWRELRGGFRSGLTGFRLFLACLILGVAVIAGIGTISASFVAGLSENGRSLLGGDLEFRVTQRALDPAAVVYLKTKGRYSETRELRGMARSLSGDARSLIEIKAVDSLYPLYGAVTLEPPLDLATALAVRAGVAGLVADPAIFERLGLGVGDHVRIGGGEFELRAKLIAVPDGTAAPIVFGPRVLMALDRLAPIGLDQPGTLSSRAYRLALDGTVEAEAVIAAANAAFPTAGWQVKDFHEAAPAVRSVIERTGLFLTLVGLTALLVGGVGVGNAATAYLAGRVPVIATLKCLGASTRLIYLVYLAEMMILSLLGIAAGLVIGTVIPYLGFSWFGAGLPIPATPSIYPKPLVIAGLFGVLTALAFTLLPLARARNVPPGTLFRTLLDPGRLRIGLLDLAIVSIPFFLLGGLAVATADNGRLALGFIGAVSAILVGFRLAGSLVMVASRHVPRPRRAWLRLAVANLNRPGAPTPTIIVSLGLGLTVLVVIGLIEASLRREIADRLPERAPSYFFIDIQPDEVAPFVETAAAVKGITDIVTVPSLRTRISALNGVDAASLAIGGDVGRLLRSERGLSYAATLPPGSTVVDGTWWPADYQGPPLVSLDRDFAKGLNLSVGDRITFDVAGRLIEAEIANLRTIAWDSLTINFFSVLSPGAVDGLPQTRLATLRAADAASEAAVVAAVTDRFDHISAIRVRDALAVLQGILGSITLAIRATAGVAVMSGLLVLAGAIAAGHHRRRADAVVMKVLGATRAVILRGFLVEYGLLGLVTAAIAALAGSLAAWIVITRVMGGVFVFDPILVAAIVFGGAAVTVLTGFIGTWRILSVKAARYLRHD